MMKNFNYFLIFQILFWVSGYSWASDEISKLANSNVIYKQLRNVSLSSEIYQVKDITLEKDVANFTLKNGLIYFLSPVEGQITGAVFTGVGEIKLQPYLLSEQRHIKHLTKEPYLIEQFSTMVFRFTDDTYQEIKKISAPIIHNITPVAQNAFDDFKKLMRKGRNYVNEYAGVSSYLKWNIDIRILQDIMLKTSEGIFIAFIKGQKYGDFLFIIDPRGVTGIEPEEVAVLGLSEKNLGYWYAGHLKNHYQQNEVIDPYPNNQIDITNFKIGLLIKGKYLEATTNMNFIVSSDAVQVLPLNLSPRLRVKQVEDSNGNELEFIQEDKDEDGDFAVIFNEPLKKGIKEELTFNYSGKDSIIDEGKDNYSLIDRSNWYPNIGFGKDRATFEMTFILNKELTIVATGEKIDEKVNGNIKISKWKSDIPLLVAGFNFGKFKKKEVTEEKSKFKIETYANEELPNTMLEIQKMTPGLINPIELLDKARSEAQLSIYIYSTVFGKHPYNRIAISQQPFLSFGQGWPMLVYLPISSFFSGFHRYFFGLEAQDYERIFFKSVNAHEIAHQWWGHLVNFPNYRDTWLEEGGSEFSASLFIADAYGHKDAIKFWKLLKKQIIEKDQMGQQAIFLEGVDMGYRADNAKTGYPAFRLIYAKGAYIFHMLRMMMWSPKEGDKAFFEMMQDFLKTYAHKNATANDFKKIVENYMTPQMDVMGNKKMDWFFNEWVYGTYLPEYSLDYTIEKNPDGSPLLYAKVSQSNVDENFIMLVPLYAEFDKNEIARLCVIRLKGNSELGNIRIPLPKKPKKIMLCAREDVLAKIKE